MNAFPDTVHFRGLNRPVRVEGEAHDLEIEGNLPTEIEGAFFRAIPDRQFPPMFETDVILSHDGMVAKLEIRDGRAHYSVKYVKTARFLAERAAGRALFGKYRNPYTDDPSVHGVDRAVANTMPLFHAGTLLMTKEDALPYAVDPVTLDTIGRFDFGGKLRSETLTAHSRIDPETRWLYTYGYEADGLASDTISYVVVDNEGALVSEQWFKAPYCSMMHDFAITQTHAIFPVFPTIADLDALKAGGGHWRHQPDRESWIGIMPRDGSVDDLVWIEGPPGGHTYHIMNAYSEGSLVHMDMCMFTTNMIPYIREDSGLDVPTDGAFARWTMDLAHPEAGVVERWMGPMGELPIVPDREQGRPYSHGWYLTIDPSSGPLLASGPAGIAFNAINRINVGNGHSEIYTLPPYHAVSEPRHIPSKEPAHGGYLIAMIDRDLAEGLENYRQEFWVFEADAVVKGPLAKIIVPLPGRQQIHGIWVSGDELREAGVWS